MALVAVTSVALGPTVEAIHASMRQVDFGEVLLLSDRRPDNLDPSITWRQIDRIGSREEYSRFMLQELAGHVSTSHALCIQWDGFVLNGTAWRPEFLNYDYIGAVWPHFDDEFTVGNGGFSLRSRHLLEACRHLPADPSDGEDVIICRLQRRFLEQQGFRFAPATVARQFSYERTRASGDEFGFHGAFNLVELISDDEALQLFRCLNPKLIAPNERWELLRWAFRHGRMRLAVTILARILSSPFTSGGNKQ